MNRSSLKKASISTFDQQTTLKPCFLQPYNETEKSLSPIKERKDHIEGPIKVFQGRQSNAQLSSRDRSSSTSVMRLKTTLITNNCKKATESSLNHSI